MLQCDLRDILDCLSERLVMAYASTHTRLKCTALAKKPATFVIKVGSCWSGLLTYISPLTFLLIQINLKSLKDFFLVSCQNNRYDLNKKHLFSLHFSFDKSKMSNDNVIISYHTISTLVK